MLLELRVGGLAILRHVALRRGIDIGISAGIDDRTNTTTAAAAATAATATKAFVLLFLPSDGHRVTDLTNLTLGDVDNICDACFFGFVDELALVPDIQVHLSATAPELPPAVVTAAA